MCLSHSNHSEVSLDYLLQKKPIEDFHLNLAHAHLLMFRSYVSPQPPPSPEQFGQSTDMAVQVICSYYFLNASILHLYIVYFVLYKKKS